MRAKPYNLAVIDGDIWDDYSVKIKGVIYEISVNRSTHLLHINKDENQGGGH